MRTITMRFTTGTKPDTYLDSQGRSQVVPSNRKMVKLGVDWRTDVIIVVNERLVFKGDVCSTFEVELVVGPEDEVVFGNIDFVWVRSGGEWILLYPLEGVLGA